MKRRLVAALACRNQGTRLYAKPLQNLDIEKPLSILQYMIDWIRTIPVIDGIVLGISEGTENLAYVDIAKRNDIQYIIGDEEDVLGRLIQCGDRCLATDIFRLTTESPFTYFEAIEDAWVEHVKDGCDITCLDNLPDGSGFEMTKLATLKLAHSNGENRHRSEFCSLYIRENKEQFKFKYVEVPKSVRRTDIRLTVDYPEDLVLCRAVYEHFKNLAPRIPLPLIIEYLDDNQELKSLVDPFVEEGLKMMYL